MKLEKKDERLSGECVKCGLGWNGYLRCQLDCLYVETPHPIVPIDTEAFERIERERFRSKPEVKPVTGYPPGYTPPPGFGPIVPAPMPDSGASYVPPPGFGPSSGTTGAGDPTSAPATPAEYSRFSRLVPADEMCRRLRAEAKKCDFDESDRATALLDRALYIEQTGDEFVPDEKMSSY